MENIAVKTPSECFRDNVWPRWQSYQSDPEKEWKAQDAARAVNSHAEWVYCYYSKHDISRLMGAQDPSQFRKALCHHCPDIAVVKDVADAAGHRFLTRSKSKRLVTTSTDAFEESSGRLILQHDGRDFLDVLRDVVNFWRGWPD